MQRWQWYVRLLRWLIDAVESSQLRELADRSSRLDAEKNRLDGILIQKDIEIAELQGELADLSGIAEQLRRTEVENRRLESENTILQSENESLAGCVERDRQRIAAETAIQVMREQQAIHYQNNLPQ